MKSLIRALLLILAVAVPSSAFAQAAKKSRPRTKAQGRVATRPSSGRELAVLVILKTDAAETEAIKVAFAKSAAFFREATDGAIAWKVEFDTSNTPLTELQSRVVGGPRLLRPVNLTDYKTLVPFGKWDSVYVISPGDFEAIDFTPDAWTNGAGFTSIPSKSAEWWSNQDNYLPAIVGGWIRQVRTYYRDQGVKLPTEVETKERGPALAAWHRAYLRGELTTSYGAPAGYNHAAWARPTYREQAAMNDPSSVTRADRARNILADPSFNESGAWTMTVAIGPQQIQGGLEPKSLRSGKSGRGVVLSTTERSPQAAWVSQVVQVQPNTTYRYVGWLKTGNVQGVPVPKVSQPGRGATLWVLGADGPADLRMSKPQIGSEDWTYVSVVFTTGPNVSTVTIGAGFGVANGSEFSPCVGNLGIDELLVFPVQPTQLTRR